MDSVCQMSNFYYEDADHIIITILLLQFTYTLTHILKKHLVFIHICVLITVHIILCSMKVFANFHFTIQPCVVYYDK